MPKNLRFEQDKMCQNLLALGGIGVENLLSSGTEKTSSATLNVDTKILLAVFLVPQLSRFSTLIPPKMPKEFLLSGRILAQHDSLHSVSNSLQANSICKTPLNVD